jgi:glycosyltransferase involved in cell wall biosynthesis
MPVTFLEQMALGLPIVAAAVDGIPFLVDDGENGLLVRSRDPAAYADAIRSLLGDPRLAARLSRNGREFVEGQCSWNATRERWLASLGATA